MVSYDMAFSKAESPDSRNQICIQGAVEVWRLKRPSPNCVSVGFRTLYLVDTQHKCLHLKLSPLFYSWHVRTEYEQTHRDNYVQFTNLRQRPANNADVCALPKKKPPRALENDRPISLTPVFQCCQRNWNISQLNGCGK